MAVGASEGASEEGAPSGEGVDDEDDDPEDEGESESDGSGASEGEPDSDAGEDDADGSEGWVSPEADQAEDGTSRTSKTQEIPHRRAFPMSRSTVVGLFSGLHERAEQRRGDTRHEERRGTGRALDNSS